MRGPGIAMLLAATGGVGADVIYVDADAAGSGTGQSWADAFTDLASALGAAGPGDQVWVAEGVYTPADAESSFVVPDSVGVYGGFSGNEGSLEERDPSAFEAVLSGDVGADDEFGSGVYWYLGANIHTSNCGHVVVLEGTGPETRLDGLTIEAGHTGPAGTPANSPLMHGSGAYVLGGSPVIEGCRFEHNIAAFLPGGAIYMLDATPTIRGCSFVENHAHATSGGAVYAAGSSVPVVEDCSFVRNSIRTAQPDGQGGALAHWGGDGLVVASCTFEDNLATSFYPVGSDIAYGGGLFSFSAAVTVRESVFRGNSAHLGGGIAAFGPMAVVNCLFEGNEAVPHPNDPYPELGGEGGAIRSWTNDADEFVIVNCTLTGNEAKKYGGVSADGTPGVRILNSIVYANSAWHDEIVGTWREQVGGSFEAAYSDITHIFDPPGDGEDPIDPESIPGCIDADPLFLGSGDLGIGPGSPCIDAADNGAIDGLASVDLAGAERFVDDPDTEDSGVGPPPVVDMGAYELQAAGCLADFNGDGALNILDFVAFQNAFVGGEPSADCDGSGTLNILDFVCFQGVFAAGCP